MKKKITIILGFGLVTASIIIGVLAINSQRKMAYFNYNEAYNECTLKKTLEADLEKVASSRQSELDSLQLELTIMSNRIKAGNTDQEELIQFEDLKNRYLTYQNRYEEENIRLKEEYFAQIRKKINEASQEFAKENSYDYFFSAVGDGSLMYANETDNVTQEFILYLDK